MSKTVMTEALQRSWGEANKFTANDSWGDHGGKTKKMYNNQDWSQQNSE